MAGDPVVCAGRFVPERIVNQTIGIKIVPNRGQYAAWHNGVLMV